jgi:hypothetical protein
MTGQAIYPFRFAAFACSAHERLHLVVIAVGIFASGCASEPSTSVEMSAATVADYASSGCSTGVVIGLSKQIAQEANCEHLGNYVSFDGATGITMASSAVLPYLDTAARNDLVHEAAGNSLTVTSALRTLAQQYLLYAWYQQGRCGIAAAATVGHSNHEGGRAVDLANWSSRISSMSSNGWAHDVPGDVVHFDHVASPDNRGEDVMAFQVLWNKNHPGDQIAADGAYGPQTQARLRSSPAAGFAIGASCVTHQEAQGAAELASVDGPDQAPPGTRVHFRIGIKNSSGADWPATAELRIASGPSPLYDASWSSPTVITSLAAGVAQGEVVTVDFDVTTPQVVDPTPIGQPLVVADGGAALGTINLALTVMPGMTQPTSGDGGDQGHDEQQITTGGCSTSGGAGWLLFAVPFVARRRRR